MVRGAKKLYTAFLIVFLVILLWLILNIIVNQPKENLLAAVATVVILFVIILISKVTKHKLNSMTDGRFRLLMLFLFAVFTGLLMLVGYLLTQVVILDLKVVYESVVDLLDNFVLNRYSHYYVVCNNNVGLLLLLGLFFKLMSFFGIQPLTEAGLTSAICFNAVMISLSVLFIYLIAKRIFRSKSAVFTVFLVAVFCPVMYIWTPVFYTDTLSMPFMTATLYLYILARDSDRYFKRILLLLAGSAVAFLGFAVKGSVAVIAVAIIINLFIDRRDSILKTVAAATAVVSVFGVMYFSYNRWQRQSGVIDFSREETIGLPIGLWFLYGSHSPGYYSDEDLNYCISFEGLEARKEAVNQRVKEIYRSYTVRGYISMATEKAVLTWSDGKYGADVFLCTPLRVNFTHHIILVGQPLYMPYTIYSGGYHLMTLGLLCLGLFRQIFGKNKTSDLYVVYLTLFGVMLFFNFWETTSRYLINMVPLLCLTAADEIVLTVDIVTEGKHTTKAKRK
ncbi:MAG: glycosyltransferase family 39 protein [Oscillospiraceae bacterium]|nr:glycosyltransferase family 39 protein [Oscillospiraceae bacterium]